MDVDIDERVNNGWIHCRFTIEVQGNHKEKVEESLNKLAEAISKKKSVTVLKADIDKIHEVSDNWFSSFIEIEALIKGYDGMIDIATQVTPSTMEILAPKKITIPASQLQTSMIDISSLISTFAHAAYIARKQLKAKA